MLSVFIFAATEFKLNCFSADVTLTGNALDQSFILLLNDAAFLDPSCGSSKGKDAFLNLNFKIGADKIYVRYDFDYIGDKGPYTVII